MSALADQTCTFQIRCLGEELLAGFCPLWAPVLVDKSRCSEGGTAFPRVSTVKSMTLMLGVWRGVWGNNAICPGVGIRGAFAAGEGPCCCGVSAGGQKKKKRGETD